MGKNDRGCGKLKVGSWKRSPSPDLFQLTKITVRNMWQNASNRQRYFKLHLAKCRQLILLPQKWTARLLFYLFQAIAPTAKKQLKNWPHMDLVPKSSRPILASEQWVFDCILLVPGSLSDSLRDSLLLSQILKGMTGVSSVPSCWVKGQVINNYNCRSTTNVSHVAMWIIFSTSEGATMDPRVGWE